MKMYDLQDTEMIIHVIALFDCIKSRVKCV